MKSKIKISVITVNYNNSAETINCLNSFTELKNRNFDLYFYVIDNGSVEDASRQLKQKLPEANVIYSKKNLGFAGGNNLAIQKALKNATDYILLINPDSLIESKDFLTQMISCKADITAPLIRYKSNGKAIYDHGGKVDRLFGRNYHLTSPTKKKQAKTADYYSGACLLIKAEVFKKTGLLDDKYFLYYEDADFCLRAVKKGFTMQLCRKAVIFHYLSTTTTKIGKKKITILADSHSLFCSRYLPWFSLPFWKLFNLYLRLKTLLP